MSVRLKTFLDCISNLFSLNCFDLRQTKSQVINIDNEKLQINENCFQV